MNQNENETNTLIEKIKTNYINNNGLIIRIPDLAPYDNLITNHELFIKARQSYKIEDKAKDILKKIGLFFIDDKTKKKDEKYWEKFLEDRKYWEDLRKLDEEQKIQKRKEIANYNAEVENRYKLMKEEYQIVLKDLKNVYKEYLNICREAFDYSDYYLSVIKDLHYYYKKYFWEKGVGKIYDGTTTEIIDIMNNKYILNEKRFINISNCLNHLFLSLENS